MMRGSVNEGLVKDYLRNILFIVGVFKVGMVRSKKRTLLSCSPDWVVIIKAGTGCNEFLEGEGERRPAN